MRAKGTVREDPTVYSAKLETPNGPVVIRGQESAWTVTFDGCKRDGTLLETLTAALGNSDPEFVAAVAAAVLSDLGNDLGRTGLTVRRAEAGERLFHLSPATNRESIAAHGLDWTRMANPGIANSDIPESRGIYLCTNDSIEWFAGMTHRPTDVWQVDVDGLWLHSDPNSSSGHDDTWAISAAAIAPNRLKLIDNEEAIQPT